MKHIKLHYFLLAVMVALTAYVMIARPLTSSLTPLLFSTTTIGGSLRAIGRQPQLSHIFRPFLSQLQSLSRPFTNTTPTMSSGKADKMSFLEAVKNRRSIYTLTKDIPISDDRVQELVTAAMENVPSSFDSRSTRLTVLLNDEHDQFWDFVKEVLRPHLTDETWPATEQRLNGFRAGHGTVC